MSTVDYIGMTREEALQKVKRCLTDYFPLKDYNEVEEIMAALEQPWTPVSEGLPKEGGDYPMPFS